MVVYNWVSLRRLALRVRPGEIGEVLNQLPSLIVPESETDEDVSST